MRAILKRQRAAADLESGKPKLQPMKLTRSDLRFEGPRPEFLDGVWSPKDAVRRQAAERIRAAISRALIDKEPQALLKAWQMVRYLCAVLRYVPAAGSRVRTDYLLQHGGVNQPNPQDAAEALGWIGNRAAVPHLLAVLQQRPPGFDWPLQEACIRAIGAIGGPDAAQALLSLGDGGQITALALSQTGEPSAVVAAMAQGATAPWSDNLRRGVFLDRLRDELHEHMLKPEVVAPLVKAMAYEYRLRRDNEQQRAEALSYDNDLIMQRVREFDEERVEWRATFLHLMFDLLQAIAWQEDTDARGLLGAMAEQGDHDARDVLLGLGGTDTKLRKPTDGRARRGSGARKSKRRPPKGRRSR